MKDELIKKLQAISAELGALEETNRACWKAKRQVDAATDVLERDWPKEKRAADKK